MEREIITSKRRVKVWWMVSMKIFAEKLGRTAPRPGYKDKFPELNASKYLVLDPTKVGPNYAEYTRHYCKIFKHC